MVNRSPRQVDGKDASIPTRIENSAKKTLTVLWNDLPSWMQDNHYIHSGYRPMSNSYYDSAASLGHLHNESVNIYTHLLGAIFAAVTGVTLYGSIKPRFEMATADDVWVFACYFLGATTCLGMSATYHTISNHSEAVAKFGNKLDYIGIVFLIWGSFVPAIYYGLGAERELVKIYWGMITSIAACTLTAIWHPKFKTSEWRPVRATVFVAMGLSAVIPIIHGVQRYGAAQMQKQMGLTWIIGQGVLYIVGAALYAARIPERWSPGTFDIWGSSHQIFHVLVLLAAAVHLVGLLKAFDYEHTTGDMSAMTTRREVEIKPDAHSTLLKSSVDVG
nr:adipor-like receptor spbc12c2.09c [Quercus suber]